MASNFDNDDENQKTMGLLQNLTRNYPMMSRAQLQAALEQLNNQFGQIGTTNASAAPPAPPNLTTPQSAPLQGMIRNDAGGYSYAVDDVTRLKRFIVIGSESNKLTSNSSSNRTSVGSIACVIRLIEDGRGNEVLDIITEMAEQARVAKEENILLVLRECAYYKGEAQYDEKTTIQRAAFDRVVRICNIPTKLFRFLELSEEKVKETWKPTEKPISKSQLKRKLKAEAKARVASENVEEKPEEEGGKKKKKKHKKKKPNPPPTIVKTKGPKKSSSWGRMRKRGIGKFYTDSNKNAARLLLLLTKYKMRHNWSHGQVLSFCHPKIDKKDDEEALAKHLVMKYVTRGYEKYKAYSIKHVPRVGVDVATNNITNFIEVLEEVKKLSPEKPEDVKRMIGLINQYSIRESDPEFAMTFAHQPEPKDNENNKKSAFQLSREHLPNGFLKLKEVWVAMLPDMPMTALIRNLGSMTAKGIFDDTNNVQLAVESLTNSKRLRKARIHPIKVLLAAKYYSQGHGDQSITGRTTEPLTWIPNHTIYKALNDAFYLSFRQAEGESSFKTGKKFLLALDVSGSMNGSGCYGCQQLTPMTAAFALSMVTWNIEDNCELFAFESELTNIKPLMRKDMTLEEAMGVTKKLRFGSTDCSLPMIHATKNNLDVDVFIVYTDSDTWYGSVHPSEALKDYRIKMNKPEAKMIVMAMRLNDVSIADPTDKYMFDIAGFDADIPNMICEIALGNMS